MTEKSVMSHFNASFKKNSSNRFVEKTRMHFLACGASTPTSKTYACGRQHWCIRQGIQRRNALNIRSSCCFYRSLSQWSWQRKTEPTKSLGKGRHCVWQTDGSIEMLWVSQLGETTLIPVPAGLSLCLTDLPGRSKWIPEAGVLDSTGSFSFLILQKKCFFSSLLVQFQADQSWPQSPDSEEQTAIKLCLLPVSNFLISESSSVFLPQKIWSEF